MKMKLKEINGKLYEIRPDGGCQHCAFAGLYKEEDPCFSCDLPGEESYKLHDTEQYETKPVDWSQCDPLVAFFLKQGRALQYKGRQIVWQSAYRCFRNVSYTLVPGRYCFDKKPKPKPKKVVLPKKELLETIIKQGYLPGEKYWTNQNPHMPYFYHSMFSDCGKEPNPAYEWDPSWLTSNNPLKSVSFLGDPRDFGLGTKVEKVHIPDDIITKLTEYDVELVRVTKHGEGVFVRGPVVKDNMKYRAVYFVARAIYEEANYDKSKIDFRSPIFTIEKEESDGRP